MRRGWKNAATWAGAAIIAVAAFCAIAAPLLVPYDPFAQDIPNRLAVPFWMEGYGGQHLLGTDQLGRDYLSRMIYGCRISMLIGVTVSIVSGVIGITLGVLGGFLGGRVDDAVLFLAGGGGEFLQGSERLHGAGLGFVDLFAFGRGDEAVLLVDAGVGAEAVVVGRSVRRVIVDVEQDGRCVFTKEEVVAPLHVGRGLGLGLGQDGVVVEQHAGRAVGEACGAAG